MWGRNEFDQSDYTIVLLEALMKTCHPLKKLSWSFSDPDLLTNIRELYYPPAFPILECARISESLDLEWLLKLGGSGGAPLLSSLNVQRMPRSGICSSFFLFGQLRSLVLGGVWHSPLDLQVILSQCPKLTHFEAPPLYIQSEHPSTEVYHPYLNTIRVDSAPLLKTLYLPNLKFQAVSLTHWHSADLYILGELWHHSRCPLEDLAIVYTLGMEDCILDALGHIPTLKKLTLDTCGDEDTRGFVRLFSRLTRLDTDVTQNLDFLPQLESFTSYLRGLPEDPYKFLDLVNTSMKAFILSRTIAFPLFDQEVEVSSPYRERHVLAKLTELNMFTELHVGDMNAVDNAAEYRETVLGNDELKAWVDQEGLTVSIQIEVYE